MKHVFRNWFLVLLALLFLYYIQERIFGCRDGLLIGLCVAADFALPIALGYSYALYCILIVLWKQIKRKYRKTIGILDVTVIGSLSLLPFFGYFIPILDIPIFQSMYYYAIGLVMYTFVGIEALLH